MKSPYRCCTYVNHQGPRWRSIIDFHVKVWADSEKTRPQVLQSWCKTCTRLHSRIRNARKRGRDEPYQMQKPGMTKAERAAARRRRHLERMANEPEYARRHREKNREAAIFMRRARGIPARNFKQPVKLVSTCIRVNPEPFLAIVEEWMTRRGMSWREFEKLAGVSSRRILDWRQGGNADVFSIDRIATYMGIQDQVAVLYPTG